MSAGTLTFDAAAHAYAVDGQPVPSVTQIIRDGGCFPPFTATAATQWHLELGTAVHTAVQYHVEGRLDLDTVDDQVAPYLTAWECFRAAAGEDYELLAAEARAYDAAYRYAGTPDQVIRWKGREAVLDLKTGTPAPWHALQTAAYARLVDVPGRLTLYLARDGTYRLATHTNRHDWPTFAAACALWHWRAEHGCHPPRPRS